MDNSNNNNNNNNNLKKHNRDYVSSGRPAAYRWPGLEELNKQINSLGSSIIPRTRAEELSLAREEAAKREREYSGSEENGEYGVEGADAIEIDFDALRFDVGADGAHTTIDFGKITDTAGLATVTTNDFVIFNKIKKTIFDDETGATASERGWSIIDLKLNQPKTALFFVTVSVPVGELKKILNKF